jgi:hypothetical protein
MPDVIGGEAYHAGKLVTMKKWPQRAWAADGVPRSQRFNVETLKTRLAFFSGSR